MHRDTEEFLRTDLALGMANIRYYVGKIYENGDGYLHARDLERLNSYFCAVENRAMELAEAMYQSRTEKETGLGVLAAIRQIQNDDAA